MTKACSSMRYLECGSPHISYQLNVNTGGESSYFEIPLTDDFGRTGLPISLLIPTEGVENLAQLFNIWSISSTRAITSYSSGSLVLRRPATPDTTFRKLSGETLWRCDVTGECIYHVLSHSENSYVLRTPDGLEYEFPQLATSAFVNAIYVGNGAKVSIAGNASVGLDYSTGPSGTSRPEFKMHVSFDSNNAYTISAISATRVVEGTTYPVFQVQTQWVNYDSYTRFCLITVTRYPFEESGYSVSERYLAKFVLHNYEWRIDWLSYLAPSNNASLPANPNLTEVNECVEVSNNGSDSTARATLGNPNSPLQLPVIKDTVCIGNTVTPSFVTVSSSIDNKVECPCFWLTSPSQDFPAGQMECEGDGKGNFVVYSYDGRGRLIEKSDQFYMSVHGCDRRSLLTNGFFVSSDWTWQTSGSVTMIADDFGEPSERFGDVCARLTGSSWIRKGLSEFPKPGDSLLVAAIIEIPNQTTLSDFSFSAIAYYEIIGSRTSYWNGDYQRLKGKGYQVLVIPVDCHYHLSSFSVKISLGSGTIKVKGVQVFGGLSCQEYYYADADSRFPNATAYAGVPTIVDRDIYGNPTSVCSDQGHRLLTYMEPVSGVSLSLPLSQKDELGFGKQTNYTNLSTSSNSVFYAPTSSSALGGDLVTQEWASYSLMKRRVTSKAEQGTITTMSESATDRTLTETTSPFIVIRQFSIYGDLEKLTFEKTSSPTTTSECLYSYQNGFLSGATLESSMQYGITHDNYLRVSGLSSGALSGTSLSEATQYATSGEISSIAQSDGFSEEYTYSYLFDPTESYETSRTTKAGTSPLWTWQTQYNGYDFVASISKSNGEIRYENSQTSYRELSQARYYSNSSYWSASNTYDAMTYGPTGKEVFTRSVGPISYHQGNGVLWEKATKAEGFYSFVPTKTDGSFVLSDIEGNTISPTGSYSLTREFAGFGRVFATSQSNVSFPINGSGTITAAFVVQTPANTNKTIAQITLGSISMSVLCYNGYLKYRDNQTGIDLITNAIHPGDWESIVIQLNGSVAKIYSQGCFFEKSFSYALDNATLVLNAVPFRVVAIKRGTTFSSAKLLSIGVLGRDIGLPLFVNNYAGFSEDSSQFPINSTQKDGAFHHLGKSLINSSIMSVFSADSFVALGDDYVPSSLKSFGIAYAKNVEFNEALGGLGWRCFGPTIKYSSYGTSTFTLAIKTVPFDVEASGKRVICSLASPLVPLALAIQGSRLWIKIGDNWTNTYLPVSWGALNKIALSYSTTTNGSGYSVSYQLSYTVYCNGQSYSGVTTVSAQNNTGHWVFGGDSFMTQPFYGLIGDVWVCKKELSATQLDSVFGGANEITKLDLIDTLGRIGKSKIVYNGSAVAETAIDYAQVGLYDSTKPSRVVVSIGNLTLTTRFGYDSNNQPNQISGLDFEKDRRGYVVRYGSQTLEYDANGNPTLYSGGWFNRTFSYLSYGLPNRLDTVAQGNKSKTFSHSGSYLNGIIVSGFPTLSSLTISYLGGLLASVSNATKTAYYTYGPDGFLCRSVSLSNEVSHYVFDSKGRLLSHIMPSRSLTYVYGDAAVPYAMIDSVSGVGKCYAIVSDALGRIVRIVDPSDGSVAIYSYDLWGVPTIIADSTTSGVGSLNRLLWKGYLYDKDLGCYCLGKRHYDPFAMRFWEPDGLSFLDPSVPGGANPYTYCLNDPITYTDPTGNSVVAALLIAAGIGAILGLIGGTAGAIVSDYKDNGNVDGSIGARDYLGAIVGGAIGGAALGFAGGVGATWLGPAIAGTGSAAAAWGGFAASAGVSFAGGFLSYSADKWISGRPWDPEKALIHGGLGLVEGVFAFGAGGAASLVKFANGKTIKIGKRFINVPETIAQNFVSDSFSNPLSWLLDIIMDYYYE